jgi:hypothetical protein
METASTYQPLSTVEFAALGNQHIAYLRPVEAEGQVLIGVFAADGRPLATAPSIEVAQALLRQNDLEPALVH